MMQAYINSLISRAKDLIKNNNSVLLRSGLLIVACVMVITTALLVVEFFYFRRQTAKMMEMKEDYRNYALAVKKILNDYHKTKERLEELETVLEEKKNDSEDELLISQSGFPEGVRVYSSDDDEEEQGSSFLLINRELEYLKQGTKDYLKKQNQQNLLNALGSHTWLDYTEMVSQEQAKAEAQKKRKAPGKKRYASRRKPRAYGKLQESGAVAQSQRSNDMSFIWPIDRSSFWLSSFYGPRKKPNGQWGFHRGIDMAAVKGTPVKAAAGGVVVEARYAQGYGKTVVVAHNAKYKTRYAHLNSILVKVGQKVERGDRVGRVGATGFVRSKRGGDASHLHLEVYVFGKQVNPMYFLG